MGMYFLGDDSVQFQKCKADIEKSQTWQTCECLAMSGSNSTQAMLMLNPGHCMDACHAPEPLERLCPKYDDRVAWCSYYAIQQCVEHTAACSHKPWMNALESSCDAKTRSVNDPDEQLDGFLRCL